MISDSASKTPSVNLVSSGWESLGSSWRSAGKYLVKLLRPEGDSQIIDTYGCSLQEQFDSLVNNK